MIELSHLGICVTDLDRSVAFYAEGLGFTIAERHEVGADFARPDTTVATRRPITTAGLTHLSFRVGDLDAELTRLIGLGGCEIRGTRTELADGTLRFVYLTDPDGTRIELMELPR